MGALILYSYRVRHPAYRNDVRIDACAPDRDAALRSLRRFVARENRRLAKAGITQRLRTPTALFITQEGGR